MKITMKLILGFGIIIIVLALISMVSYLNFNKVSLQVNKIGKYNLSQLINSENEAIASLETLAMQNDYFMNSTTEAKEKCLEAANRMKTFLKNNITSFEEMKEINIDSTSRINKAETLLKKCEKFEQSFENLDIQINIDKKMRDEMTRLGDLLTEDVDNYYNEKDSEYINSTTVLSQVNEINRLIFQLILLGKDNINSTSKDANKTLTKLDDLVAQISADSESLVSTIKDMDEQNDIKNLQRLSNEYNQKVKQIISEKNNPKANSSKLAKYKKELGKISGRLNIYSKMFIEEKNETIILNKKAISKLKVMAVQIPKAKVLNLNCQISNSDDDFTKANKLLKHCQKLAGELIEVANIEKDKMLAIKTKGLLLQYTKLFIKWKEHNDQIMRNILPAIKLTLNEIKTIAVSSAVDFQNISKQEIANIQSRADQATFVILLSGCIAIIIGIIAAIFLILSIKRPVDFVKNSLVILTDNLQQQASLMKNKLASGDWTAEAECAIRDLVDITILNNYSRKNDEIGNMCKAELDIIDAIEESSQATNMVIDQVNDILLKISETADKVSIGSVEVASSSQSLSQGATEQAASLEQVSASMSVIVEQTNVNANNAQEAKKLAQSASSQANLGRNCMLTMSESMSQIVENADRMKKVIKTIDDIAFQTNLLALNAAVEAARAGQHGKGFAVVAEEVRNLAARSATAAAETTQLIEQSNSQILDGVQNCEKTSDALKTINVSISETFDFVTQIAESSSEQAESISQINQGLDQINIVTQKNTANSEETASASEEMSSSAGVLSTLISNFTLREDYSDADSELYEIVPASDSPEILRLESSTFESEM